MLERCNVRDNAAKTKFGAQLVFLINFLIIFINLLANDVRKENKTVVVVVILRDTMIYFKYT